MVAARSFFWLFVGRVKAKYKNIMRDAAAQFIFIKIYGRSPIQMPGMQSR
jgi:hypothetical protein